MDKHHAIETLKRHRAELERRGVRHAALFGSTARGEQGPKSDIDILIDIDPTSRMGVYEYAALKNFIGTLFEAPVDVVERAGLKPAVRPSVLRDAVDAF